MQATLKPNLPDQQQHAIIYTSKTPPDEKWYYANDGSVVRENLNKDPIKVIREQRGPEGDLHPASRLNYSKIYTVENYVRVLNIGKVHPDFLESMINNALVRQRQQPPQRARNPPTSESSSKGNSQRSSGSYKEQERDRDRDRDRNRKHKSSGRN